MTSGVPQGSVLGPVLFIAFINDLVNDRECPMFLFADDAKLFTSINTIEDIQALKRDMKRLETWSQKWLLRFNAGKCVTMHLGNRNPKVAYELDGVPLRKSSLEKDLDVHVSNDLKSSQVKAAAAKANKMVGLIRRNFRYLNTDICRTLYCTLVRPHIEYAI